MMTELTPKRFELLVPQAGVIALLVNPNDAPSAERTIRDVQEAARSMWRQIRTLKAGTESEIDSAFATSSSYISARSSLVPTRSSTAGAASSWRSRHTMLFRQYTNGANSQRPAA